MDMAWTVVHSEAFEEWFTALNDKEAEGVAADIRVLETFGPQLGRPHVDTLEGSKHNNMKELRTGKTIRTAFAFDPTRKAVLLCAGDKAGVSSRKFYKALIDRADAIYDQHVEKLKQEAEEQE